MVFYDRETMRKQAEKFHRKADTALIVWFVTGLFFGFFFSILEGEAILDVAGSILSFKLEETYTGPASVEDPYKTKKE